MVLPRKGAKAAKDFEDGFAAKKRKSRKMIFLF